MTKPVRTRFAPSPTGYLHVGGVRTALFAWLIARQAKGQFILRLEDTDQAREVEGSGDHIMASLSWLGLNWDEGPDKNGKFGPYRQSERLNIYNEWAQKLLDSGKAYVDPYTMEEVDGFRAAAKAAKQPFLYRNHRPETRLDWDHTKPLRFKSDPKTYKWHDEVLGDLAGGAETIDDFVIIKSDGYPTYNFAHIIDDNQMQITHVIRSQEFVPSTPRFINLYEALEFEIPKIATLPYVMGPDGKKKLSKRDGARDILDYARAGYLPEALINFLATLGWNDGTEKEIFTVDELINSFKLDRVQKSGARFDEQRLLWLDGAHIRALTLEELYEKSKDFWPEEAKQADDDYKKKVLSLVQERLKYLSELPDLVRFFFVELPINKALIADNKQLNNFVVEELKSLLEQAKSSLNESDFSLDDITNRLNHLLEQTNQKPAVLFSLIRIAVTEAPASPGLADTLIVLGKAIALSRIDNLIKNL